MCADTATKTRTPQNRLFYGAPLGRKRIASDYLKTIIRLVKIAPPPLSW
jgi:hypothetical protein